MNKLLEILDEFDKLTLGYCDDDELDEMSYLAGQAHFKEYYKKFLQKKLVEYAKHVTSIGRSDPLWTEFQVCRIAFERRIDQDSLSLNN